MAAGRGMGMGVGKVQKDKCVRPKSRTQAKI